MNASITQSVFCSAADASTTITNPRRFAGREGTAKYLTAGLRLGTGEIGRDPDNMRGPTTGDFGRLNQAVRGARAAMKSRVWGRR